MFKRVFWLVTGAGFGFGMSLWAQRAVKRTAARYSPQRVSGDVARTVKGITGDVKAAVLEGREAMREREAALRADGHASAGARSAERATSTHSRGGRAAGRPPSGTARSRTPAG